MQFLSNVGNFRKYGKSHRMLYSISLMIFFWSLFDGIVSFITPIVITDGGLSKTMLGFILGSSSLFGALFDFFLSKVFQNVHYRRIYLLMFAICFVYPLVLWQAKTVWLYLIAMAMWGLYYDLNNWGNFDVIGRVSNENERSVNFSVLYGFKSLGYLIAPFVIGLLIGEVVNWKPFFFMSVFIALSFVFFGIALKNATVSAGKTKKTKPMKSFGIFQEILLWKKVGHILWPVLIFTMIMYTIDAFFWTIGPLFSEYFNFLHVGKGVFLAMYTLPPLFIGWGVGPLTKSFGKKKTAYISTFIGAIILASFPLIHEPVILLSLTFIASCFIAVGWPSINGAYVDYLKESPILQKEIEALEDSFTNFGYVLGPISAGILADKFGNLQAFSILGIFSASVLLLLMKFTPKK